MEGEGINQNNMNPLGSESLVMYRRFIESIRSGIFMVNLSGVISYANIALANMIGHDTRAAVTGLNLFQEFFKSAEQKEAFLHEITNIGSKKIYEFKYRRPKDGLDMVLTMSGHYIRNEKGEAVGVEGVVYDVTDKAELEANLLNEKHKLELLLGLNEKVNSFKEMETLVNFVVDEISNILQAKRVSLMKFDDKKNELYIIGSVGIEDEYFRSVRVRLGDPIVGIVAEERKPLLIKNIEYESKFQRAKKLSYMGRSFIIVPILNDKKLIGAINVADKMPVHGREVSFDETDLKIVCAIGREVAVALENVELYKELNLLTVTDPLTHIYNYRKFSDSLEFEFKRLRRSKGTLCIMMMDVDKFKSYNDTYGHLEGDALLSGLGEILKSSLRETDVVCRYAGDEFCIVLPDSERSGAKKAAEKIKDTVESYPFKRKVTISLGVAQYEPGIEQKELIRRADKALYESKHKGRNQVFLYDPSMDVENGS